MNDKKELVVSILKDLGKPTLYCVEYELARFPAMAILLKRPKVSVEDGHVVLWRMRRPRSISAEAGYFFLCSEIEIEPGKLVDLVLARRKMALISMCESLEEAFWKKSGKNADPSRYRTIILRGHWLNETRNVHRKELIVTISSLVDFEEVIPEEVKPDVIAWQKAS